MRAGAAAANGDPAANGWRSTCSRPSASPATSSTGDGGKEGPDLTHAAKKPGHDAAWFERWITDPSAVDPIADMPAFGGKLSAAEMTAISAWLATNK